MEGASPARLYATLIGGTLLAAGIIGFFYSAAFNAQFADVDNVFGILAVNGWHNMVHILTGALGLLAAGYAAREYALGLGALYIVIAIWGFIIGNNEFILGFVPVNTEDNVLHLILGLLGVGAGLSTPAAGARPAPATP
jgi:Domain of unknown function (DUF4383)